MSVFSRRIDVVVVALSWTRTVAIEQGRWRSRRTAWKPAGGTTRNVRAVRGEELGIVFDLDLETPSGDGVLAGSKSRPAIRKHTYFEYEEFEWHKYRSFTAKGDDPAGVRWPGYDLGPDQRESERRATYRAKFSAAGSDEQDEDNYLAELDEPTWRTLTVGLRCRLTIGAFSGEVKHVIPA